MHNSKAEFKNIWKVCTFHMLPDTNNKKILDSLFNAQDH